MNSTFLSIFYVSSHFIFLHSRRKRHSCCSVFFLQVNLIFHISWNNGVWQRGYLVGLGGAIWHTMFFNHLHFSRSKFFVLRIYLLYSDNCWFATQCGNLRKLWSIRRKFLKFLHCRNVDLLPFLRQRGLRLFFWNLSRHRNWRGGIFSERKIEQQNPAKEKVVFFFGKRMTISCNRVGWYFNDR